MNEQKYNQLLNDMQDCADECTAQLNRLKELAKEMGVKLSEGDDYGS